MELEFQAREISSVLSAGRFEARVHDGWPPLAFPAGRPRYERPEPLGSPFCQPSGAGFHDDLCPPLSEHPAHYRAEITVEAEDVVSACRSADDALHTTDGWKSLDTKHSTYVSACR